MTKIASSMHEGHYDILIMPFDLSNSPSTLQAIMNNMFQGYLTKFAIVIFENILVFSRNMDDHIRHLIVSLQTLLDIHFSLKKGKC